MPPLALLDLTKPGERQAHDFLMRATSGRDRMWELLGLRRREDVLLCVVRWVRRRSPAKLYSLADVSLAEVAVCWRDFVSLEAAQQEMERLGISEAA